MMVERDPFSLSVLGDAEGRGEVGETPAHAHLNQPPLRGGRPRPPMGGEEFSERSDA